MLRNVLLIATTSGLPLFSQEFLNGVAQPRLVGSLLTIMMELSIRTTGLPVSYIELANVAVTMVKDETVQVCCALFHDCSDGPAFGKLVATQILFAFLEEYSVDFASLASSSDSIATGGSGGGGGGGGGGGSGGAFAAGVSGATDGGLFSSNLRDFHGFRMKISRAVIGCVRPVLGRLHAHQSGAVLKALLVMEEGTIEASGGSSCDVDQMGMLANLQAILLFAAELLAGHRDDTCGQIVLDSVPTYRRPMDDAGATAAKETVGTGDQVVGSDVHSAAALPLRTRTTIWRIGRAVFILVVDKDVPHSHYKSALDEAEFMLSKICAVVYDNHLMRRE
jgi:hypothetical protein